MISLIRGVGAITWTGRSPAAPPPSPPDAAGQARHRDRLEGELRADEAAGRAGRPRVDPVDVHVDGGPRPAARPQSRRRRQDQRLDADLAPAAHRRRGDQLAGRRPAQHEAVGGQPGRRREVARQLRAQLHVDPAQVVVGEPLAGHQRSAGGIHGGAVVDVGHDERAEGHGGQHEQHPHQQPRVPPPRALEPGRLGTGRSVIEMSPFVTICSATSARGQLDRSGQDGARAGDPRSIHRFAGHPQGR